MSKPSRRPNREEIKQLRKDRKKARRLYANVRNAHSVIFSKSPAEQE